MKILNKPMFFLLSLLFSTSTKCRVNSQNPSDYCYGYMQKCSYRDPVQIPVQFPFQIRPRSLPSSCGYPGFDLLCNREDKLQIHLPNSGVFSIKEIDYVNQQLLLNDPDNCLPKRLLALNGSNVLVDSPFNPVFEQDYLFYNCSNDFFFNSSDHQIRPIKCLSGESYGMFATTLGKIVKGNSSLCRKIGTIKGPFREGSNETYTSLKFQDDIVLNWAQPRECRECYRRNGDCGFKSNSSFEVGCFNLPRSGFSKALVGIALPIATPILVLTTFCITYFLIKAVRYYRRRRTNIATLASRTLATTSEVVTSQPRRVVVVHGLDQSIIESYPKVTLGESKRLPKPDEKSCPICLGEYLVKEIIRIIPHCGHCFHSECIGEWLLLNASCPVCRNYPPTTPENSA